MASSRRDLWEEGEGDFAGVRLSLEGTPPSAFAVDGTLFWTFGDDSHPHPRPRTCHRSHPVVAAVRKVSLSDV